MRLLAHSSRTGNEHRGPVVGFGKSYALLNRGTSRPFHFHDSAAHVRIMMFMRLLLLGLAVLAAVPGRAQTPPPTISIRAARVLDGRGGT